MVLVVAVGCWWWGVGGEGVGGVVTVSGVSGGSGVLVVGVLVVAVGCWWWGCWWWQWVVLVVTVQEV